MNYLEIYLKALKLFLSIYISLTFISNSIASEFIDKTSKEYKPSNIINEKNTSIIAKKINPRSNKMSKKIKRIFPTGIERDLPIPIIIRKDFNERLKNSSLWVLLDNHSNQNLIYDELYYLNKSPEKTDTYSIIRIFSRLGPHNSNYEELTSISYSLYENNEQRSHKISDRQLSEMKELLKIVIKDLDDKEAWRIIENLYAQYNKKLSNKNFIQNGMVLVHTKHDGKIIAFYGVENDFFSMFRYMEIT